MSSNYRKYYKLISNLSGILLILVGSYLFITGKNIPTSVVQAQSANSLYFSASSVTVAPKATLLLKANAGSNAVSFSGGSVQLDITNVQVDPSVNLSFPLVLNKTLFTAVPATSTAYINCNQAVTGDSRCTNGVIKFALAKCPAAAVTALTTGLEGCYQISNTAQTGIYDLISIPLVSVNNTKAVVTSAAFTTTGNELVKDAPSPTPPTDLTITTASSALTVPIRGDSNMDGYVTAGDLSNWRTNYGGTVTTGATVGDFNGDGYVTAGDLSVWRANYGKGA